MRDPFPLPQVLLLAPPQARSPYEAADRQHLARLAQADPIANRHSVGAAILNMRAINEMHDSLARRITEL